MSLQIVESFKEGQDNIAKLESSTARLKHNLKEENNKLGTQKNLTEMMHNDLLKLQTEHTKLEQTYNAITQKAQKEEQEQKQV